jgi:hypothetical protein
MRTYITVKRVDGVSFTVRDVELEHDTWMDVKLKLQIADQANLCPCNQRIIFAGKECDDAAILPSARVFSSEDWSVHFVLRMGRVCRRCVPGVDDWADRAQVLPAVTRQGLALRIASQQLQNDKEVVLAAVAETGAALKYASEALRNDKQVALVAAATWGSVLPMLSAALQADKEVVLVAVAQDVRRDGWAALSDSAVPEALQQDPAVQRLNGLDDSERELPHELLRLNLFGHLQFVPRMLDERIMVEMLPSLTDGQLRELGMTMGERIAFMSAFLEAVAKVPEGVPPGTVTTKFASFYQRMGMAASINGFEATPLSSLRETVTFIVGPGTPAQPALAGGCAAAEARADALLAGGPDEHGLNRDEIAAIHLYTQDVMYTPLNRALWSEERGAVKPYWGYIRLLQHALFKVPKCEAGTIYRGIKEPYQPITEPAMLAKATQSGGSGEPEIWWGFSSCSTDLQATKTFLGMEGVRVLYTIEGGSSARDVRGYSAYPAEAEVLMPFGSAFTVVTAMQAEAPTGANNYGSLLLVTLRQTHDFVYGGVDDSWAPEPEPE